MPFNTGEDDLLQLNPNHDFDFSVQFEQLFFSIIPSVLFIITSFWRTFSQARKPTVVHAPVFQRIKVAAILAYVGLELSLLILVIVRSFHETRIFIASSALKLVSALFMTTLSVLDHSRSPRPSVLLNLYLALTLLLDAAQARTLFLSSDDKSEITYSSIFISAIAVKAAILFLEARHKSRWVSWDAKKHSPEETSGIFSLGVYFWLNRMFLAGYKKILTLEDLYPLDSSLHAKALHDKFSANMDYGKLRGDKFGLLKVLMRALKVPLLLPVVPRLAVVGFKFCQPLFLERLLEYLAQPGPLDANVGYGLIGASVLIYGGIAISSALTWYFHHRLRTMISSILVTETFIQATKARIGTADDSAALTLMSTDVERIRVGFRTLHEIWACVIQAALASWMVYNRLGVAFVAAVGTVMVCSLGVGILIRFTGDSQRAWMAGVQKRVGLTSTVIAGMKNLKMSGFSAAISDFVQNLRVEELAMGARYRKVAIAAAIFAYSAHLISPALTFAVTPRALDASRMFTSLTFISLLTTPLMQVFQSVPQLVSALACLGRIQAFLECETRHDFRRVLTDRESEAEKISDAGPDAAHPVVIKNGRFGWEADKFVLRDINTRVRESSLTAVIGPVGSGKSTFCKALLGEIPFSEGSIVLGARFPRIGFCDQIAFLFNGSIRDNIVGFSPFDSERYAEVIDATALRFDLATLPEHDRTNIGSDGISLSGGQKQRVSLARALYLQSDLLVLDDIFSGLDADTEEQVFRNVFGPDGLLRRRRSTVVLCTHSIRHLPAADYIIALGEGTIVEQGSFGQLIAKGQGYVHRLGLSASSSDSEASSEKGRPHKEVGESASQMLPSTTSRTAVLALGIGESRQVGDRTVYKHYIKSMGWLLAASSLFYATLWGFLANFPTIWLTYWTDDLSSAHPNRSYAYYAGIYALLQISAMISLLLLGIALFITSIKRAGARLHRDALRTLMRAPLAFFTSTDTGVVTNLFSQDLNLIDTELPNATLNTLYAVSQALGQAAVMLTSSLYLAISYPFLAALLYVVQRFYLRTSRQLRFLDLETKSPLYTHFLDTRFLPNEIEKNARLIDSSQRPAYLLLMIQEWLNLVLDLVVMVIAAILTTLAVRLHSSSAFAGASLFTLVSFGENLSGIVIFYTMLETSLGAVARLNIFNKKVKPEDREGEDVIPPKEWPRSGRVELKGVSATYHATDNQTDTNCSNTTNLALRNIHLTIHRGEKVAICGRTGSGKSSLIALLLKLLDPVPETAEDAVMIDQTPLRRINRAALRERIIAVPQEAVFLPDGCTVQANLDPSGVCTPGECEAVLAAVGMWNFVRERGGLAAGMSAATLSAGQRQLLSLGRALLRRRIRARSFGDTEEEEDCGGGILLLDEVSSSVDRETERVMQEVIRAEFERYTVLAVSHRLDMIMDFDRVVVMDRGEIVEVGNPMALAARAGTRFGDLVRAAHN